MKVREVVALLLLLGFSQAYRLNVPRVLLPYHPTIPVEFHLEVSQPTGGCFYWRSTRPDIVSVTPVGVRPGECSDKATIRSTAKSFVGELSAVIFADDKVSGTTLSCGVSVDHVHEIRIETTTKVLFVDAAPVRMIIDAFNKEGDHFSTLSSMPIEWELVHNGGDRPLRIVPFEQSSYEAPYEIVALEKQKKKGYMILLEGVITGSAILSAKFNDLYLDGIAAHNLDLTVVANLLLIPSYDLYIPVHSIVPFQVLIVKQHSTEVVPMPSSSYYLQVDDSKICDLNVDSSSIHALVKGKTDIHLLSHNIDVKAKTGVRPPFTSINVVDPESLQWTVSGDNWILQSGTQYQLHVSLIDPHGNSMYIGDNLRFDSKISNEYFDIVSSSVNQSYFLVTPKKVGKTTLKSKFISVITRQGKEELVSGKIRGEQNVHIVDPVKIVPPSIILPYLPRLKSQYTLTATGGSGLYDWSSSDSSICTVDAGLGMVTSGAIGKTTVSAVDRRNNAHYDTAEVAVLDVLSLSFGKTRKEAEVGSVLVLNLQLFGAGPNGAVPFDDCRNIQWTIQSGDKKVFEPLQSKSGLPDVGTGCATVSLRAVSSGDTKVTVSFESYHASIDVSAFPKLELAVNKLALAVGSDLDVKFSGGPRPWILEPATHMKQILPSGGITADIIENIIRLECGKEESSVSLKLSVGNSPSDTLPIPVVSEIFVPICCAKPNRIIARPVVDTSLNKCHSKSRVLLTRSNIRLSLNGYGTCDGSDVSFDSISGLEVKWSAGDSSIARIDTSKEGNYLSPVVFANTKTGEVPINAEVASAKRYGKLQTILKTSTTLKIVERAHADPPSLVLWNEGSAKTTVVISGGSGYFTIAPSTGTPYQASIAENKLIIAPQTQGSGVIRVIDSCLSESDLDVPVKISDIHSLAITGPKFVEIGSEIKVTVEPADETGATFSRFQGTLSDSKLEFSNSILEVSRTRGHEYTLRAIAVGAVSVSASAKSSSGRMLHSLPHSLQVFSPISLHPKVVTLIPESTFQLEVRGGPIPTPPISFALNNSKIAQVETNALITSQNLGYTSVTGTLSVGDGHITKDTVTVHVVSLKGIQLVASTQRAETGSVVWVRVQGLDDEETPFSFGGAHYPFTITWSVSHPDVLRSAHPLGPVVEESNENKFAVWFEGVSAGSVVIEASVRLSRNAKNHFVGSNKNFNAKIEIKVEDPLSLRNPAIPHGVVRIAPNTQIQLETAWPLPSVEFSVPTQFRNTISITPSGYLRSHGNEGYAAVAIRRKGSNDNETSLVPVAVNRIHSLDVTSTTPLATSDGGNIIYLPVGTVLKLNIHFRDSKGRILHGLGSNLVYRPHRFDLTEVSASSDGKMLTINMKSAGETVLRISDSSSSSLFTFVRLAARENLFPSTAVFHVSDVICLRSPLEGKVTWSSPDRHVQWIDSEKGVAKLLQAGTTHITANSADQSLHAKLTIEPAIDHTFSKNRPDMVSNYNGASFVFPLITKSNASTEFDCTPDQLEVLSSVSAPFECSVLFTSSKLPPALNLLSVKATYVPKIGYACVVEPQVGGVSHVNVIGSEKGDLTVVAKFNRGDQFYDVATHTVFHLAMQVINSEIQLSDVDSKATVVSILVPAYQASYVALSGCSGDLITIREIGKPVNDNSVGNKFFSVKLNIKSATVWNNLLDKCALTVTNKLTGQESQIPVRVKLVGKASKHVYEALESNGFIDFVLIFVQHYSSWIPTLMGVCIILILSIGAYWYLSHFLWEKQGVFLDETNRTSSPSSPVSHRASFQDSMSFYRESPRYKSTPVVSSPRMGSLGDSNLWSTTSPTKRILLFDFRNSGVILLDQISSPPPTSYVYETYAAAKL
ncbi:unnamed protein product [Auanema sp. JU1783]|nr:unnamed protein product [Auanema sp. JU1783]